MLKLVKEFLNEGLNLSNDDYSLIYKKLEYSFKKNNGPLVEKIRNKEPLSDEDLTMLLKKFEYTYRKSDPEIIKRIKDHLGLEVSNIKFSNLKAKQKRDLKQQE